MLSRNWLLALPLITMSHGLLAAEYEIDPAHSFVTFRIQHLGYAWMYGQFNDISGRFSYDAANPEASTVSVTVDPASIDTNYAERDKDLRSARFLDVDTFGEATFEGTRYSGTAEEGVMEGNLNVHGVTKPVSIEVTKIGEGDDPWGGYRAGFIGTYTMSRSDFGITQNLGPASESVEFELSIEGIRQ